MYTATGSAEAQGSFVHPLMDVVLLVLIRVGYGNVDILACEVNEDIRETQCATACTDGQLEQDTKAYRMIASAA